MTAGGPFPQALPNDPEDVAWALSTGQAMWNRGDVLEAIRWVKRASESASDAGADDRAFALARAAADLKMATGAPSVTPSPPEVAAPLPVIPAPPPPLASPSRPTAFAPPSRPPTVRPPPAATGPSPRIAVPTPTPGPADKRPAKIGATTLPSAGTATPKPKPVSPSSFPLPNANPTTISALPSSGAPASVPPPARASASGSVRPSSPPLSARGGTMQMSAAPNAYPFRTPSPAHGVPAMRSYSQAPPTIQDSGDIGEETLLNEKPSFTLPADPPPALIEDFPTMARVQPFELTGATDPRLAASVPNATPTSRTPQPPPASAIPLSPASIPPPRATLPTPPTALIPAARVWLFRQDGLARVAPLSAPRPEGAVEIVVLSVDETINLLDFVRP